MNVFKMKQMFFLFVFSFFLLSGILFSGSDPLQEHLADIEKTLQEEKEHPTVPLDNYQHLKDLQEELKNKRYSVVLMSSPNISMPSPEDRNKEMVYLEKIGKQKYVVAHYFNGSQWQTSDQISLDKINLKNFSNHNYVGDGAMIDPEKIKEITSQFGLTYTNNYSSTIYDFLKKLNTIKFTENLYQDLNGKYNQTEDDEKKLKEINDHLKKMEENKTKNYEEENKLAEQILVLTDEKNKCKKNCDDLDKKINEKNEQLDILRKKNNIIYLLRERSNIIKQKRKDEEKICSYFKLEKENNKMDLNCPQFFSILKFLKSKQGSDKKKKLSEFIGGNEPKNYFKAFVFCSLVNQGLSIHQEKDPKIDQIKNDLSKLCLDTNQKELVSFKNNVISIPRKVTTPDNSSFANSQVSDSLEKKRWFSRLVDWWRFPNTKKPSASLAK